MPELVTLWMTPLIREEVDLASVLICDRRQPTEGECMSGGTTLLKSDRLLR